MAPVTSSLEFPGFRRTLTAGTSEGFTGHRGQAGGSVLLTQYRAYDTELGRWLSQDPIAVDGPNLSTLYPYAPDWAALRVRLTEFLPLSDSPKFLPHFEMKLVD